jgi:hypothetical protein
MIGRGIGRLGLLRGMTTMVGRLKMILVSLRKALQGGSMADGAANIAGSVIRKYRLEGRRLVDAGLYPGRTVRDRADNLSDGLVLFWGWLALAGGVLVGLPFSEYPPAGGLVQHVLIGLAVIFVPPVVAFVVDRLVRRVSEDMRDLWSTWGNRMWAAPR